MKRDPIIQPASNASGRPSNASAGRIKSVSGGGPSFSPANNRMGSPPPNNPYKGR